MFLSRISQRIVGQIYTEQRAYGPITILLPLRSFSMLRCFEPEIPGLSLTSHFKAVIIT